MLRQALIERELRVQARAAGTYWLRVVAALAVTAALAATLLLEGSDSPFSRPNRGPWLLALLHTSMSLLLAGICPLMISDTLARERREGTLGILLLTPLPPATIVSGKLLVHLIRAGLIWLATVPTLTVPVLLGGVGLVDVVFAVGIELGIILASLAAGLIASSIAVQPGRAMAGAVVLTLVFGECLALVSFLGLLPSLIMHPSSEYAKFMFLTATFGPWFLGTGLLENGFSGVLGRSPGWLVSALWLSLGAVVAASLAGLILARWLAARRVRRLNRQRDFSPPQERRRQQFFRPWLTHGYVQSRRARMRNNPIHWLYTHPLSGLRRWGWCGVVTCGWGLIFAIGLDRRDAAPIVFAVPIILVLGLALAAATSFRRELEERTLELLLVTPLQPRALLQAQVLTLWRDFLPALLLSSGLAGLWNALVDESQLAALIPIWCSFLCLPLIGSRLAVRQLSPVVGWLWTLGVGGGFPWALAVLAGYYFDTTAVGESFFWRSFLILFTAIQLLLAVFCGWCTLTDLATRRFRLKPLQSLRTAA